MELQTRTSEIRLDENGIIWRILRPGAVDEVEDAREALAAVTSLCDGVPRPVLNDMRGLVSVSREARNVFADPQLTSSVKAAALLADSPATSLIGSFFLGLNHPPYPAALFTDLEEALAWLKSQL